MIRSIYSWLGREEPQGKSAGYMWEQSWAAQVVKGRPAERTANTWRFRRHSLLLVTPTEKLTFHESFQPGPQARERVERYINGR
jgi:hypothetical protein